ncbi:MAG: hypothetical protein AB1810_14565 [Pseudomonadota bacterium]
MTPRTYLRLVILLPLVVMVALTPAVADLFNSAGRFIEFALLPYALFAVLALLWIQYMPLANSRALLARAPLVFFVFLNLYLTERLLVGSFAMPDLTSFGLVLFATDSVGLMLTYVYALIAEEIYHHHFRPARHNRLRA